MDEGDRFFQGRGGAKDALLRIAKRLNELGISYAVAGGMALNAHGYRRFTEDVDILVRQEDLDRIYNELEGRGYLRPFSRSKNLRDTELGVKISMDGRGRWMDNVFIERLWRSVKYEEIYLKEHSTIPALHHGLETWFTRYNHWRPHQHLGNLTPAQVYQGSTQIPKAA